MKKKAFCLAMVILVCSALCMNVFAAGSGMPMLSHTASPLVRLLLPFVIAAIVCFILISQMKTAKKQNSAKAYESDINITVREDHFTHKTQTRIKASSDRQSKR